MAITHNVVYSFMRCQSGVATRGDKERLRETKLTTLPGPGDRGMPIEVTWERHQGGQEAEDGSEGLGHSLYWGFHRKDKQGRVNILE